MNPRFAWLLPGALALLSGCGHTGPHRVKVAPCPPPRKIADIRVLGAANWKSVPKPGDWLPSLGADGLGIEIEPNMPLPYRHESWVRVSQLHSVGESCHEPPDPASAVHCYSVLFGSLDPNKAPDAQVHTSLAVATSNDGWLLLVGQLPITHGGTSATSANGCHYLVNVNAKDGYDTVYNLAPCESNDIVYVCCRQNPGPVVELRPRQAVRVDRQTLGQPAPLNPPDAVLQDALAKAKAVKAAVFNSEFVWDEKDCHCPPGNSPPAR